eukprot:CCRYP_006225-RC/>CCRYP_006225-RC protein AED:0.32 eAED:0.32 QI:948/1/1/1/0/0/4/616/140
MNVGLGIASLFLFLLCLRLARPSRHLVGGNETMRRRGSLEEGGAFCLGGGRKAHESSVGENVGGGHYVTLEEGFFRGGCAVGICWVDSLTPIQDLSNQTLHRQSDYLSTHMISTLASLPNCPKQDDETHNPRRLCLLSTS